MARSLWLLIALVSGASTAAAPAAPSPVLIIIDIQNFYFEGGLMPLELPEAAAGNARRLLDAFRAHGWPVVHVRHLPRGSSPDSADDPQYLIRAEVAPAAGETVVGKHFANAFRDTDLLAKLRALGASRLVICGMQTQMCVEAAVRAAADLGFEVTVVGDACATRDLTFGGTTVAAAQVHVSTLASLQGTYASVADTDGFLAGADADGRVLEGGEPR